MTMATLVMLRLAALATREVCEVSGNAHKGDNNGIGCVAFSSRSIRDRHHDDAMSMMTVLRLAAVTPCASDDNDRDDRVMFIGPSSFSNRNDDATTQ